MRKVEMHRELWEFFSKASTFMEAQSRPKLSVHEGGNVKGKLFFFFLVCCRIIVNISTFFFIIIIFFTHIYTKEQINILLYRISFLKKLGGRIDEGRDFFCSVFEEKNKIMFDKKTKKNQMK